jgi:hypothetical protein
MRTTIKRTIFLAIAFCGLLSVAPAARCAEFMADVSIDRNGAKYAGTAYVKGTNVRYELTGGMGQEVIIYRADFGAQWTIYPKEGVYTELWNFRSDDFIMPEVDRRLIETATDESLGTETVAGLACDIRLHRYDDPSRGTLTTYRSLALDYPIKIELLTKGHYLTKEYRNIRRALLNDSLFELPKDSTMLK